MDLDPATLPVPERYKLLIGGIVPRPIAVVSTADASGRYNVAPFSFFAGVGSNPMSLLFCPANKPDGSEKDTLINCKPVSEGGTGEFVVNVMSISHITRAIAAAEELPYGESEFPMIGLTPTPSSRVAPPRIAEAAVSYECRTLQVIRTNPGAPAGGNIVIGEVVHVWIREGIANDRLHVDPAKLDAAGRMGGYGYCTTRDRFDVPPGRAALSAKTP
ncbi:MAG: flavin reductase family protein [Phycisphaerales bacterium]